MEEIESEFSLRKNRFPEVAQKIGINAGKDCQEVCFECTNGAFGDVAEMHVGRGKLEGSLPVFSDDSLEVGAAFVIHGVMVDLVAALTEALHD